MQFILCYVRVNLSRVQSESQVLNNISHTDESETLEEKRENVNTIYETGFRVCTVQGETVVFAFRDTLLKAPKIHAAHSETSFL